METFGRNAKCLNDLWILFMSLGINLNPLLGSGIPPAIETYSPTNRYFSYQDNEPPCQLDLACHATGIPEPSIKWTKNGFFVTDDSRKRVHVKNGTLIIGSSQSITDEGYYQCVASNIYGNAHSHVFSVKSDVFKQTGQPGLIVLEKKIGESVVMSCRVKSSRVVHYTWVNCKTYETINDDGGRITWEHNKGTLYMANVIQADELLGDRYCCIVVNVHKYEPVIVSAPYNLSISEPAIQERPPTRMLPDEEQTTVIGLLGKPLHLKCFFEGLPTPKISWTKGLMKHVPLLDQGSQLTFTALQLSDELCYKCTGKNTLGSSSAEICVKVGAKPVISRYFQSKNLTEGQDTFLECSPKHTISKLTISWYYNGMIIDPQNPGPRRTISKDMTKLIIYRVCKYCSEERDTDIGVYKCNMTNEYGYDFYSMYIHILEPTQIVMRPSSVTLWKSKIIQKVSFTCISTTDPSTDKIQYWIHNGIPIHDDEYSYYHIYDNKLEIDLTKVSDDELIHYLGEYTCYVTNGYSMIQSKAMLSFGNKTVAVAGCKKINADLTTLSLLSLVVMVLLDRVISYI